MTTSPSTPLTIDPRERETLDAYRVHSTLDEGRTIVVGAVRAGGRAHTLAFLNGFVIPTRVMTPMISAVIQVGFTIPSGWQQKADAILKETAQLFGLEGPIPTANGVQSWVRQCLRQSKEDDVPLKDVLVRFIKNYESQLAEAMVEAMANVEG